ncbi:hypothetical protein SAMN05421538_103166 [Paracoccus isoporae]|uniref:LPS sulfotransferase NodH n=1 Tax=Paracoccus isoporae TaxID=591205 RepID=A0A1G6Z7V5_9RHOB|nr:sulfotransferase family 2 domain-containing protein [Paracoccus isoporae]SDD97955.1 hypothetical protein SAMN05421538_103166 [Paracoccus isoporae]
MSDFRSFVIFAEMRTGSNLLEATLNSVKHVTCFGEAFNPYMLGWPETDQIRGVTKAERENDPLHLLAAICNREGHLSGFRYFHDHDLRVFDTVIGDRRCAKIVLTRNPLDSYVSTQLAWQTNQWKLNETETPIPAAINYDGAAFREGLDRVQGFQARVLRGLQVSGQSAFWLNYDDLRDAEIMTGLLHWLGRTDLERVQPASDQVPQNPRDMAEKVANFDAMQDDLARLDPFQTSRIPTFEPRRGPAVPSFVASGAGGGMLFMPVRGGPVETVEAWMESGAELQRDFNQQTLRAWLKNHPRHRSFTVLRHPLRRAWSAFTQLLEAAPAELRQQMRETHRVSLPDDAELSGLDAGQQVQIFAEFLDFLRRNLNGQTSLQVFPHWASQTEILAGFSRFLTPDMVLREDDLERGLGWLAEACGQVAPPVSAPAQMPDFLDDKALQKAARAAYTRDYIQFGFSNRP